MAVVHVNDVDLHYEIHGREDGFPLVLAHGYCTSINLWKHQIPLLAERYRVIAYDARGHGLSSAPAGREHYTLNHLVADMHALLRHLGIEQAYIAGHSMGGATTAGFAAKHPEMTKAALICNIDGGQQPSDPEVDRIAAETRQKGLALVRERGLADYARRQIADKLAPPFIIGERGGATDLCDALRPSAAARLPRRGRSAALARRLAHRRGAKARHAGCHHHGDGRRHAPRRRDFASAFAAVAFRVD